MARPNLKKERTVHYRGEEVPMEWHAKFEKRRGRMYFEVRAEDQIVLIGAFTTHFKTTSGEKN